MKLLKYLIILLLFTVSVSSSEPKFTKDEIKWIKDNPVVKFGADYKWPPFDFTDAQGKHTGLSSEYIKLISKKSGLKFKIYTGIWSNVLKDMQAKKYDGLTCAVETDDRKKYLNFTKPYLSVPMVIITQSTNQNIKTIDDLKNKVVSINKGSYIHEWLETRYPKIKLHLTTSNEASLEAISLGKADAYVGNLAVSTYIMNKFLLNNLKIVAKLKGFDTAVSIAIDKTNIMLFKIIQKSLKSITPQEHQVLKNIWKENLETNDKLLIFTKKQEEWIKEHSEIRFVIDNYWKPIEFLSKDSKTFKGLSSSYLELVGQRTGIKFKRIATSMWSQSVEKINSRDADLYTCVAITNSRKKVVNFSKPYIKMPQVFVTNQDTEFISNIKELYGKKIVLVEGYYITEMIKKEHPFIEVMEVKTIKEALENLTKNKAFAYVEMLAIASNYIQQGGFSNLKISGMSGYSSEFSMALRNDWSKEGIEVINKVLDSITQEEKNKIYNKWLHVKYDKEIDYTLLWQVVGVFILLILASLLWNARLSREIKTRKKVEQALTQSQERFELALKGGDLGSWDIDFETERTIVNERWATMLGYSYNEMNNIDKSRWVKIIHTDDISRVLEHGNSYKRGLIDTYDIEYRAITKDCKTIWVESKGKIVQRDLSGNPLRMVGTVNDITEKKSFQTKLEIEKEKAELATKAKSDFLSNMSHEIRTPMNAILGFAELLDDNIEDKKLKSFIKTIRSSGQTLLFLINDILDLSKIESGKLELIKTRSNIQNIFEEILNIFKLQVEKKSLKLELKLDEKIPTALLLDQVRLKEILINLVGNAIKFTEEGYVKIIVIVNAVYEHTSKIDLTIRIEDSGIGVDISQQDKIFNIFEQTENQDVKKYGGTGLGLAISRKLAKLMNGSLTVESELSKGSNFILKLNSIDIASLNESEINMSEDIQYSSLKFNDAVILVVDDIQGNRDLVKESFYNTNIDVLEAENGKEAIEIVKNENIDLILMDIRMPVMDGYTATRLIKNFSNLPIIALTASIMQEELKKLKGERFDGYLRKPVSKNELYKSYQNF